jgi:PAS domain S-box-containing protein
MNALVDLDTSHGFIDHLLEGAWVVDQRLTLLRWNRPVEVITGYSPTEVLGERCPDDLLLALDPTRGSLHSVTELLARACQDLELREIQVYLRHKLGHLIPAWVRIAPIRDATGQPRAAAFVLTSSLATDRLARRRLPAGGEVLPDLRIEPAKRRLLEMYLRLGLNEMYRHGWSFGVVLIRIAGLEELTADDTPGLADQALLAAARTLASRTDCQDVLGRWRYDAFLTMCRNIGGHELEELADLLRALVVAAIAPFSQPGITIRVASGAALASPGHTFDSLIRQVEDLATRGPRAAG